MANLGEVLAFRHCFGDLQTGLKEHLGEITPRLFAKSLISTDNMNRVLSQAEPQETRTAHLLTVLLNRIQVDPSSFHLVLKEINACAVLQLLAKKLREELEQMKEKAAVPPNAPKAEPPSASSGTAFTPVSEVSPTDVCVYNNTVFCLEYFEWWSKVMHMEKFDDTSSI